MLETIGGLEQLNKVYSNSSLRLQIKFRPKNPSSHSAIGDKVQLNNLLARTIKKKITYTDGTSEIKYETVIIGLIESTFRFKTLADFQYVPIERINYNDTTELDRLVKLNGQTVFDKEEIEIQCNENDETDKLDKDQEKQLQDFSEQVRSRINTREKPVYKSVFRQVYPHEPLDGSLKKFDENAPLFVMPIIFSRFDTPSDYLYKNDAKARNRESAYKFDPNKPSIELNRKSRAKPVFLVTFQEDPPKERPQTFPNELDAFDQKLLKIVENEFKNRPVWSKAELAYRNNCKKTDLKPIMPLFGFYYTNGPFRGQWVRFGYNIKEQKDCAIYQTLDLRMTRLYNRKLLQLEQSVPISKMTCKSIKTLTNEKKLKDAKITSGSNDTAKIIEPVVDIHSFKFIANHLPKYKQIFFQLTNIELDEAKEILNKLELKDYCDEKDGWWKVGTIDKLRSLMLDHVDNLLLENDKERSKNMLVENRNDDEEMMQEDEEEEIEDDEIMQYYE